MALGFIVTNITDRKIRADKNLRRTFKPRVRSAKFGDGYEQRRVDGINNINESYSVNFNNRTSSEADDIIAFFNTNGAVTSFDFTLPDTNSTSSVTGKVDLGGQSASSKTTYTLDAATTNLDISVGSTVTGGNISGTVTATSISGTTLVLSSAQNLADNTVLTFSNPNERKIKVVCSSWNLGYISGDYYSVNATFERVFEP